VHILILNWRCPRNPKAGGAELVTHEIAKRLVAQGNYVEWFAASFPGAPAEDYIDGVRVLRAGRQWTVHWAAYRHYRRKLIGRFDVVIDQVNTIPFFTPLWAEIPHFMFIHQLAREVWWYESPFPISALGYVIEPLFLRVYRRTPVLTVSRSTEADLRKLNFSGPIVVIPEGLEPIAVSEMTKETKPTFLFVGRVSPSKRLGDVLTAFSLFRRKSVGQLWIAGNGSPGYINKLVRLCHRLGISQDVQFLGLVSNHEKHNLMARAHSLVLASAREGWGLVVTEANACGTPAVVYDVPGLRDSVRHEETGLVVKPNVDALAEGMIRISSDRDEYARLMRGARSWSRAFSYDSTTAAVQLAVAVHTRSDFAEVGK
jgi:glycosyltransferase involved in cell wall biosynthesis